MNSISIYVAISAISLVKCHVGFEWVVQPPQTPQLHKEEEDSNRQPDGGEDKSETDFDWRNDKIEGGDFFQSLRHLKRIYDQCETKVNKRLKKIVRTKVKSPLGRHLTEFREYVLSLYKCVKVFSFRSLDEILEEDLIPLTDHAYFVKDGVNATQDFSPRSYTGDVSLWRGKIAARQGAGDYAASILNKDWSVLIYDRLANLLRTHSLKFQVDGPLGGESMAGRGRRRDHRMFAMMVMGFMIMASILIPMGFQFLTVLGGKSLLMAKMALIMSAINGLKKIATSNVGYGFYHTGSDGHHHDHVHHGFHEKLYHVNPQHGANQYGYNP